MFTNLSSLCIPDGTTNVSNAREFSAKIRAAFFKQYQVPANASGTLQAGTVFSE